MIFTESDAPTPECHASTLIETDHGLLAAWFGGKHEKHPSVGIWCAHHDGSAWSQPVEIANGETPAGCEPCWNPVLFQATNGPLCLFYKTGHTIAGWQTHCMQSRDGGLNWGEPRRLDNPILGPVRNKPVQLADGTVIHGGSDEPSGREWQVYISRSNADMTHWELHGPLTTPSMTQAIQPTLLQHGTQLVALCRTREGRIGRLMSADGGRNWGSFDWIDLPNPNSGIDAVTLADGRHLLVYNHTTNARSPLNVAISVDTINWEPIHTLEASEGEYSYPAVIQARDGTIHISYTWNRRLIQHVAMPVP